jgi:hypothetical protein
MALPGDQPVAFLLRHEQFSGIHHPTPTPSRGHFCFAQSGHSHFTACVVDTMRRKVYTRRK